MNKSVYSLVLSDDVVAAVDRAAYRAGMSRSAYINAVLADAVSYVTPEKRISDIFNAVEQLMDDAVFRIMPRPSDTALAMRSALQYKYKPVIRYSIEMSRTNGRQEAQFKASLRTQSAALISDFARFLHIWSELERSSFSDGIKFAIEDTRYTRTFDIPSESNGKPIPEKTVAAALSHYIGLFDKMLKLYFANADDPEKAGQTVIRQYKEEIGPGLSI